MSRLPALKPKEAVRILERAGFSFVRQKGTLHKIIKQAGLTTEEFYD